MTKIIDYNALTDSFVSLLESVNTVTASYDLSLGLGQRVKEIIREDLFVVPKFKTIYPIISVLLSSKREDFMDFNTTRRGRKIYIEFAVTCVMNDFIEAERELWVLIRNLDAIIREYPSLNEYVVGGFRVQLVQTTGCSFSIEFLNANIRNFLFKALATNESMFTKGAQVNVTMQCYLDDAS